MKSKKIITLLLCVLCILSLSSAFVSYGGVQERLFCYSETLKPADEEGDRVNLNDEKNDVMEATGYDPNVAGYAELSGAGNDNNDGQ